MFYSFLCDAKEKIALDGVKQTKKTLFKTTAIGKRELYSRKQKAGSFKALGKANGQGLEDTGPHGEAIGAC